MKSNIWAIAVVLFFGYSLSSCNKTETYDSQCKVFNINLKNHSEPSLLDYSSLMDSVKYIPLETSDSCVMGAINYIRFVSDTLYITDNTSIFIFDKTGSFINKISKRGRGHGEYLVLGHIDINPKTGEICVYDNGKDAILIYSKEGVFKRSFPVGQIARDFAVTKTGDFLFCYPDYASSGAHRGVWLTDCNGHFKKELITSPKAHKFFVLNGKYFVHVNPDVIAYLGQEDYDNIYHIINDSAFAAYHVNVDIKMPKVVTKNRGVNMREYEGKAYYKSSLIETDNLLTFTVANGLGRSIITRYDKANDQDYQYLSDSETKEFDYPYPGEKIPLMMQEYDCYNGVVISQIPASMLMQMPALVNKLFPSVTLESNPVVGLMYTKSIK